MSERKIWRNAALRVAWTCCAIFAVFSGWNGGERAAFGADSGKTRAVAVVAGAGYDATWEAAERIAAEMKFAEAIETVRAIYGDVQGVDRSKPFGLVVATDGSEIVPFAFLPVASVEKIEFVGASDLKEKIEKTPEGIFLGAAPRLRLLEKDGWLFVFEAGKEAFVPTTDPTAWIDGGEKAGFLSVDVDLTALPKELLEAGFAALRQKAAENAPTDDEAALEQFETTLEYYSAIFDSLERVAWTLNVDATTGDLAWGCAVVAKDGSPLAETFAGAQNAETRWGAIAETPNSVFAAINSGKYSALDREFLEKQQATAFDNAKKALEIGLGDAEELALAEELFAVVEKFAKSAGADGTFDSASAFACGPVVFSSAVASVDGSELTAAARKIFDKLKTDEPESAGKIGNFVKFDAETVAGFSVSKIDVPLAEFDAELPEAFAAYWSEKTLAVRFGTSADAILLVAGVDSAEADAEFARIAAASKTKTPAPKRASLAVAPLANWALEMFAGSEELTGVARKTLERIAEADDARFEVEYKIDGRRLDARYVVKSDVFRLIGDVVRLNLAARLGSGGEGEDVDDLFDEE
ncbi:MAG: hypothetical protein IKU86_08480 [Thermoguttaceae bacterium]|nr:hypothetical protein [Thermoguttaceae bacterium]